MKESTKFSITFKFGGYEGEKITNRLPCLNLNLRQEAVSLLFDQHITNLLPSALSDALSQSPNPNVIEFGVNAVNIEYRTRNKECRSIKTPLNATFLVRYSIFKSLNSMTFLRERVK